MPEEIVWKKMRIAEGGRIYNLNVAQVGMAVLGNERQIVVADELQVIRGVAFLHDDGTVSWVSPPNINKDKSIIESKLKRLF
jgi:hypothetical protein